MNKTKKGLNPFFCYTHLFSLQYMNWVIFEAIFVGFYSSIIFQIFQFIATKVIKNMENIELFGIEISFYDKLIFLTGFFKHFLGYFIRIQSFYCYEKGFKTAYITSIFLPECFLEGFVFLLLKRIIETLVFGVREGSTALFHTKLVFLIGFLIHILSELFGFHDLFIKYRCK